MSVPSRYYTYWVNGRPQSRATIITTIVITSVCAVGLIIVLLGSIPESYRRRSRKKSENYWRSLKAVEMWKTLSRPRKAILWLLPLSRNEQSRAERGSGLNEKANSKLLTSGTVDRTHDQEVSSKRVLASDAQKENALAAFALAPERGKQALINLLRRRRRRKLMSQHKMLYSSAPTSHKRHVATVAQMQFSRDGKYLATCRSVSVLYVLTSH